MKSLLLVFLTGCIVREELACTEIGCADELRVVVTQDDQRVTTFTGEWREAGGVFESFSCPSGSSATYRCDPGGELVLTTHAATVELRVNSSATETLTPTYEESRPNGPACEPLCRQAAMTVELE
jgi:hypothetical protein